MRSRLRGSGRTIAAAVCVGLLLLELPAATAGGPGRSFFAPADRPGPAKTTRKKPAGRLRALGHNPVGKQILHPIGTVRGAARAAKSRTLRAIFRAKIARLDRRIANSGAGGVDPSADQLRRSYLRLQRWKQDPSRHDEARELLAAPYLVLGEHGMESPIGELELTRSAAALEASATAPEVLLPVDMGPSQVRSLLAVSLEAVAGRRVYGAPDGVADLLRNDLVAFSVVERTLAGARAGDARSAGWLTANQREVVADLLADGNPEGAAELVAAAYRDSVQVALAAAETYRTDELRMDGALPLSIQAAIGQRPELAGALRALEAKGVTLRVRTMVKTPPGVRRAALEYGAIGEETEFSPFVDQVSRGLRPDPRPTEMGVTRAIVSGRFSRRKPPTAGDLEKRIDLVDHAVAQVLVIEAHGPAARAAAGEIARINRELEPVRRVMAVHRIVFDVKHEAGEGARKLLPMVAGLAAVATGLQAAGAGEGAILVAEGGEDVVQGAVEGASQDGALRSRAEVWRTGTKLAAAGALAISAALAKPIHHLADHGMGYLAGPLMGIGSMALSATVFGNAVQLNKKGRIARLRTGKVANTVPQLMFDPVFQKQLKKVGGKQPAARRAAVLALSSAALRQLVLRNKITGGEMKRTVDALAATTGEAELRAMITMPGRRSLWKAAFGEALGTPTRRALGQGMILTIVASSAVGAGGLLSGPAWGMAVAVLASAGEGLWGLYRSYRFERENRTAEQKALREMAGI